MHTYNDAFSSCKFEGSLVIHMLPRHVSVETRLLLHLAKCSRTDLDIIVRSLFLAICYFQNLTLLALSRHMQHAHIRVKQVSNMGC